jgi:acyl carrier protein
VEVVSEGYRETVRTIAEQLNVLGGDSDLKPLDSLTLIELVMALEDKTGLDLIGIQLSLEQFRSIDTVVALLEGASKT